jgi:hypothetical protein
MGLGMALDESHVWGPHGDGDYGRSSDEGEGDSSSGEEEEDGEGAGRDDDDGSARSWGSGRVDALVSLFADSKTGDDRSTSGSEGGSEGGSGGRRRKRKPAGRSGGSGSAGRVGGSAGMDIEHSGGGGDGSSGGSGSLRVDSPGYGESLASWHGYDHEGGMDDHDHDGEHEHDSESACGSARSGAGAGAGAAAGENAAGDGEAPDPEEAAARAEDARSWNNGEPVPRCVLRFLALGRAFARSQQVKELRAIVRLQAAASEGAEASVATAALARDLDASPPPPPPPAREALALLAHLMARVEGSADEAAGPLDGAVMPADVALALLRHDEAALRGLGEAFAEAERLGDEALCEEFGRVIPRLLDVTLHEELLDALLDDDNFGFLMGCFECECCSLRPAAASVDAGMLAAALAWA